MYRSQITNMVDKKQITEEEDPSAEVKSATLMLFTVDWCPHCKTAAPEWKSLQGEYQDRTINGYNIIFDTVNCTNETADVKDLIQLYSVEGYPTVKLVNDSQVFDFDAKPTKDNLLQFLKTTLK